MDDSSTRLIHTLDGPKPYSDLVDALAIGVQGVMEELARKVPSDLRFTLPFIQGLHCDAFASVVPWAGRLRTQDVQVRAHMPPTWHQVPTLLRNFADNLEYRVSLLDPGSLEPEQLAEVFAYAEGRFTHIHPFEDFNGRTSRLLNWALVLRLQLPVDLTLVPPEGDADARRALLDALAAYDVDQPQPLEQVWLDRLYALLG